MGNVGGGDEIALSVGSQEVINALKKWKAGAHDE